MKKTLLRKYFSICVSLVLVSMCILGAILMMFSSQLIRQDKYDILSKIIDKSVETLDFKKGDSIQQNAKDNKSYLDIVSNLTKIKIYFYDLNGQQAVFCTEYDPCIHTIENININILKDLKNDKVYKETGNLLGLYVKKHFTVAKVIKDNENNLIGYVFASTEVNDIFDSLLGEIVKMFIISAIVVLFIVMIIVYFVTKEMVKPLQEISDVAKEFSKGNFSRRIDIERYDEIGQLAMSMNNMAESLSILENMRRSFISNVSHELRTPMTTISGFIDGILDGTITGVKEKQYLQIVSEEIKRLSRVVKSMLNLSRIEAGEMTISCEKVDIIDTICKTLFNLEHQINSKHLDIRGLDREKIYVNADKDLIHQVLYNLVENAIKFSDEGGYIEFNFTKQGNEYLIGVKNSGEGLSREEIPRVFDRFYKTDRSRGLDKNGVGLGLYIVHSIINLHGGEIIVKSVKGEYCEFIFSLQAYKQNSKIKKKNENEIED